MGLLTSLPFGDLFECVDIPPDECCESRRVVLGANERSGIFEGDLTVPRPGYRGRSVSKGLRLSVDNRGSFSDANVSGVSRGAIGLLSRPNRCHTHLRGDKLFSSPICHLGKR
jgi:hypothetical protein